MHGSPRKVNEYLFEDKPASTVRAARGRRDCDALVFGHTHQPWMHEFGGVFFVNCGSVGKPKDGDPRGAFAVLDPTSGRCAARDRARRPTTPASVAARSRPPGCPREYADKLLAAA